VLDDMGICVLTRDIILFLLDRDRGIFRSGEELAKIAGVSRAAVGKQVSHMKKEGIPIMSRRSTGYMLPHSADVIVAERLRRGLSGIVDVQIHEYDEVGSTNDVAGDMARIGAGEWSVVVAETQHAGKGRLGRAWDSQRGGLWLSVVLRPDMPPRSVPLLSLLAGLSVANTINEHTGLDARVKWPNDVKLNGKKVCGILSTMSADAQKVHHCVIGIGINVNNPILNDLQGIATSLSQESCGKMGDRRIVDRTDMLTILLRIMKTEYDTFQTDNGTSMLKRWRSLSETLGRNVTVVSADSSISGLAMNVDSDGGLIIRTPDGETLTVHAGDCLI